MKKTLIAAILICVVSLSAALLFGGVAGFADAASLNYDEADLTFLSSLDEFMDYENYGDANIVANKEVLYNLDLDPIGYFYDFTINGKSGYAVVMSKGDDFEVSELTTDAQNPFINATDGKRIYLSALNFAYFDDDAYYLASDGTELSDEAVDSLKDMQIGDGASTLSMSVESETIMYTHRSVSQHNVIDVYPTCYDSSGTNAYCMAVAAANLVQFFDRYYPNLIPNYDPGTVVGTGYEYKEYSSELEAVVNNLASRMGVTGTSGATIQKFKSGLTFYCISKYCATAFAPCMTDNQSFDFPTAKGYMDQGYPIVVFVTYFNNAVINESENKDVVNYVVQSGNHAMAAFGYKTITYTLESGQTRTDTYLAVSGGMSNFKKGYYNVNYTTQFMDAYGINIY